MRSHSRVVAGLLAVVALAVVIGALGGWARSEPEGGVRVVQPGTEVAVAPFRVRLDSALATYAYGSSVAEPAQAFLVVQGFLALDHPESVGSGVLGDLVVADLESTYDVFGTPQDEPEASVEVAGDGSTLLGLAPGLGYRVRLVYVVDEAAVPASVTVTLNEQVRRKSFIDGTIGWFDPSPAVRTTIDVAPLPDQRPDEDVL